MQTLINKIEIDWTDIKNKCRTTMGKEYTSNAPSSEFKKKLLISEHSPIRLGKIDFSWKEIKSWISVHYARHHIGWEKFISTQRDDRIGGNRDKATQDTLVNMDIEANMQSLINVSRVRLCRQASSETRAYMEDFKRSIGTLEREMSDTLVPNCVYRCGCPEFNKCFVWKKVKDKMESESKDCWSIQERYDVYNAMFAKGEFND